jgi:hypothetical protein
LFVIIFCLEGGIYLWAINTTEAEFVFDKCARNSGRVSSLVNLAILLITGYYGYKKIYSDILKKDAFRILLTLFAVNHLVHFFYVYQNFKSHLMELSWLDNLHGVITFIFIMLVPLILWLRNNLNILFYAAITIHLFNVSYFIMKTFYSKVKPDAPAYHNQLGIAVTAVAMLFLLYKFIRENKPFFTPKTKTA